MDNDAPILSRTRAFLAAIVAIYVAYSVRFWFVADDAYITFRFSQNVADGLGLRYNLGDHTPVEGYSNFLWLMLAVPFERLRADVGLWMCVLSILTGVALLLYVHWTLRRYFEVSEGAALLAALCMATLPTLTIWATSGLETMPFALFTFATFERLVLARRRDAWLGGAVAALGLSLIRTEGIAWVGVIVVMGIIGRSIDGRSQDALLPKSVTRSLASLVRPAVLAGLLAVALFGAYFASRSLYFDSWVSNTTKVKVGFGTKSLQSGLAYVSVYYLTTLVPLLAFLGAPATLRRRLGAGLQVFLLALAFPVYAIVVGGDYLPMGRMLVPGTAFAVLMIGIGIDEVWKRHGGVLAVTLAAFALLLGLAPAHDMHPVPTSVRKAFHFRSNTERFRSEFAQWEFIAKSTPRWRLLGEEMAKLGKPGDTWVAGAIGAKGYYSELFIYDMGGLVTREVAERPAKRKGRSPGHEKTVSHNFFMDREPTFLRARMVPGDHRAVAAEVRSWKIGAAVKKLYVPQIQPVHTKKNLVVLRRATEGEDTAAAWASVAKSGTGGGKNKDKRAAGRWHHTSEGDLTTAQKNQIEQLEAIGYLSGSQEPSGQTDVTIHDADRARPGYNLYISGHGTEAVLIDMDGAEVHRWGHTFKETWPRGKAKKKDRTNQYWRRAWLLEDGHLLAMFEGHGLVELDRDSRVEWAADNQAHHDVHVLDDGRMWTLTRKAHVIPAINKKAVLEDFATLLAPRGKTVKSFSILKAVMESKYAYLFENSDRKHGDLFHTNAIEVLDGSLVDQIPQFKAGNLMVSSRILDAIIVLDPKTERAVWARTGAFRRQHDPHVLPSGKLLLFDNVGLSKTQSRVVEIDPKTGKHGWAFTSGEGEPKFFSRTCGLAERLDNGNTLITESAAGRAIEVTPERQIVWEFHNPHRAGKDDAMVATLFEVQRIDASRCDWLEE